MKSEGGCTSDIGRMGGSVAYETDEQLNMVKISDEVNLT